VVATLAGGGAAGVGLSVSVVVAGAAMSQDAHDGIYCEQSQLIYSSGDNSYYVYEDEDGHLLLRTLTAAIFNRLDNAAYVDEDGTVVNPTM
jgi:hypothetical protein